MYHRIVSNKAYSDTNWTCVQAGTFRRQMELVERLGFTPITLFDYLCYLDGAFRLPRKPIVITFDDGYQDTYENAFPILDELGMKAVVFVLGNRDIKTNRWDHEEGYSAAPLMTDEQVIEMSQAGYEIGAHSLTHPRLTLIDKRDAWEEIARSRMSLEIILNSPVSSFSYPYGALTTEIKNMVTEAGYKLACGVFSGPARFGEDLFEIRRLAIPGTLSLVGFASRLLLPHQRMEWIRWKIKTGLQSVRKYREGRSQVHAETP